MKKTIAVGQTPKDAQGIIARGNHDGPNGLDEMLLDQVLDAILGLDRVVDRIIDALNRRNKAA